MSSPTRESVSLRRRTGGAGAGGSADFAREDSFRKKSGLDDGSRRKSSGGNGGGGDTIRVICRFRPGRATPNKDDSANRTDLYELNEQSGEIKATTELLETRSFAFDRVFGFGTTQVQVFDEVHDVIGSVLAGFNGTVMAYGQTSAGKSHTMEGSMASPQHMGIIPRCIHRIFEQINQADSHLQFQIMISYYEIYCEKIRDLLNPSQANMQVRQVKNTFVIQDLTELSVTDAKDCFRVIELGKTNRATSPTLMNAESSRSHSVFSLSIEQRSSDTGRFKKGKLFLVDLAGSEKVSKTGASGLRLEEAKNINSSLTSLGMVINALSDSASHVPFRDSKLTMLLMDALGGNSKTTLIICCNPEAKHSPETVSTLRFGERAKKIKTHAKVNEELSVEELKALLAAAKKEIAQLRQMPPRSADDLDLLLDEDTKALLAASDPTPSVIAATAAAEELQLRLGALEEECGGLRARVGALEEELETERMRSAEEHGESMQHVSEAAALKTTIEELEARLLKATMSARARASSMEDMGSALDGVGGERRPSTAGPLPPPRPPRRQLGVRVDNESDSDDENVVTLTAERVTAAFDRNGGDDKDFDTLMDRANRSVAAKLGEEIRGLSHAVSVHEIDARSAQADAQNYADKYTKLREEYESQVQRLMIKLTHEQATRTALEDKLEDAYQRMWQLGGGKGKDKDKGLFSGWFSKAQDYASGTSRSSFTGRRSSTSSSVFTDREQNLLRSLELAQRRVTQLMDELESLKEAQGIVLGTKESVMRSLARQNSQILIERDGLLRRNEELVASIEQLTTLLRSKESRMAQAPMASPRFTAVIHGGSHHRPHAFRGPPADLGGGADDGADEEGDAPLDPVGDS